MLNYFQFEADFVNSLRCIPMQVRYKLDTCGIKLKLSEWHQMSLIERENLVKLPCNQKTEIDAYREYLQQLILQRTGTSATNLSVEPNPVWMDSHNIPTSLQEKVKESGFTLTLPQWANLTPLERFVLIKLSRPGHENHNFPKAMDEFDLI
ncbi:MAG: nitrate reductase associated protein [Goleter apudmare HA4340-LM2]|jgi:hypothetical protein|nr:nitrate reductase associated protein [Goleter apudmare HA4340-LM2]